MPPKTEQQKKSQKEYMKRMSRIEITMKTEKGELVKAHAEGRGESVNAFVNRAIDEAMERDEAEPQKDR